MTFEIGIEFPQCEQLLPRDDPGLRPCGVQDWRRVPLREDEPIIVLVARIRHVVAHLGEEERRHQFGHGTARAGMTRTRFTGREHRIDAQACGDVLQRYARGRLDWQGRPPERLIIMTRCSRCGTCTYSRWSCGWAGWSSSAR